MRHTLLSLLLLLCSVAQAQTALYIHGTAVPGGVQRLERFSQPGTFKFHGTLLPGTLYVATTQDIRPATRYYKPSRHGAGIVCSPTSYTIVSDSAGASWQVLFEADNYRFTVAPSKKTLEGELFAQWYECWIVGGCVAPDQNGDGTGNWQIKAGKEMTRSMADPNVWSWVGLLKAYQGVDEPRRLKINGQYGWSPKVLHPFTQDQSLTSASQLWYGDATHSTSDYKWAIQRDGYYHIEVDVFRETINATYLGTEEVDADAIIQPGEEADGEVAIVGREVRLTSSQLLTVRLYSEDGTLCDQRSGQRPTLHAPAAGFYLLHATNGEKGFSRKIVVP